MPSARELAAAWTAFVTDIFMVPEGCGRPEVDAELIRLEDYGLLQQAREDRRIATDRLIVEILRYTPESRSALMSRIDHTSLALVYDRVQIGTRSMLKAAEAGIQLTQQPELPEMFHLLLLQKLK